MNNLYDISLIPNYAAIYGYTQADLDEVFVPEVKVVEDESDENVSKAIADAIKQIRERGYADSYQGQDTSVHIIGMVFGKQDRNLVGFQVEAV